MGSACTCRSAVFVLLHPIHAIVLLHHASWCHCTGHAHCQGADCNVDQDTALGKAQQVSNISQLLSSNPGALQACSCTSQACTNPVLETIKCMNACRLQQPVVHSRCKCC